MDNYNNRSTRSLTNRKFQVEKPSSDPSMVKNVEVVIKPKIQRQLDTKHGINVEKPNPAEGSESSDKPISLGSKQSIKKKKKKKKSRSSSSSVSSKKSNKSNKSSKSGKSSKSRGSATSTRSTASSILEEPMILPSTPRNSSSSTNTKGGTATIKS